MKRKIGPWGHFSAPLLSDNSFCSKCTKLAMLTLQVYVGVAKKVCKELPPVRIELGTLGSSGLMLCFELTWQVLVEGSLNIDICWCTNSVLHFDDFLRILKSRPFKQFQVNSDSRASY